MSFFTKLFRSAPKEIAPAVEPEGGWPLITEKDFEALLAEESAGVKGWTEVKNEKNIKVWKNTNVWSLHDDSAHF